MSSQRERSELGLYSVVSRGAPSIWEWLLVFPSVMANDLATKEAVLICPSKQITTSLHMLIVLFYFDEVMQIFTYTQSAGSLLVPMPECWVEPVNDQRGWTTCSSRFSCRTFVSHPESLQVTCKVLCLPRRCLLGDEGFKMMQSSCCQPHMLYSTLFKHQLLSLGPSTPKKHHLPLVPPGCRMYPTALAA